MTTNNGHVSSPLAVRGATLKFGGVTALDDVSISVADDELLAIIGPNGAGKTSLLNVTAGFYRPQKGRVELSGEDVTGLRVDQIARRGLARTFQGTHLFAGQTVVENIMIGRHMLMKSNVVQAFFQFGPVMREESEHRLVPEIAFGVLLPSPLVADALNTEQLPEPLARERSDVLLQASVGCCLE